VLLNLWILFTETLFINIS